MERTLILTCTTGLWAGDYYRSPHKHGYSSWNLLPEGDWKILALDSTAYSYRADDLPILVSPGEEHRFLDRGWTDLGDPGPRRWLWVRWKGFVDRIVDEFPDGRVLAVLTPMIYRACFCAATERLNAWDRVTVVDLSLHGWFRRIARHIDWAWSLPPGVARGKFSVLSVRWGDLQLQDSKTYRKAPTELRYLDYAPIHQVEFPFA